MKVRIDKTASDDLYYIIQFKDLGDRERQFGATHSSLGVLRDAIVMILDNSNIRYVEIHRREEDMVKSTEVGEGE